MRDAELTRRAKLRALAQELIDDLLLFGYTPRELERRSIVELDEMRHRAARELMAAPRGGCGDGGALTPMADEAEGPPDPGLAKRSHVQGKRIA